MSAVFGQRLSLILGKSIGSAHGRYDMKDILAKKLLILSSICG